MFSHGLYNKFNLFLYNSGSSLMHRHDSSANAYHSTVPCMAGRYVYAACLYSVFIYFCKAVHVGLLGSPLSLDQSTE